MPMLNDLVIWQSFRICASIYLPNICSIYGFSSIELKLLAVITIEIAIVSGVQPLNISMWSCTSSDRNLVIRLTFCNVFLPGCRKTFNYFNFSESDYS